MKKNSKILGFMSMVLLFGLAVPTMSACGGSPSTSVVTTSGATTQTTSGATTSETTSEKTSSQSSGTSETTTSSAPSTSTLPEGEYPVLITQSTGGTISADKASAKVKVEVKFTVALDSGYSLTSLTVNDTTYSEASLTKEGNNYVKSVKMAKGGLEASAVYMARPDTAEINIPSYDPENPPAGFAGSFVSLPKATATANGQDVSAWLSIADLTDPDAEIASNAINSSLIGLHTVRYSVTYPGEAEPLNTKDINVKFVRELAIKFNDSTFEVKADTAFKSPEEQTIWSKNNGFGCVTLAGIEDTYNYYFETRCVYNDTETWFGAVGLGHNPSNNGFDDGMYVLQSKHKDLNFTFKNHWQGSGGWGYDPFDVQLWGTGYGADENHQCVDVPYACTDSEVKMAIARLGNYSYFYINDVLVFMTDDDETVLTAEGGTYPEIIFQGYSSSGTTDNYGECCQWDHIDWCDGEEAVKAKLATLNNVRSYAARGMKWAAGSRNVENDHYTIVKGNQERGAVAVDYHKGFANNDALMCYPMYSKANFTYEFDALINEVGGESTTAELDIRDYLAHACQLKVGYKLTSAGAAEVFMCREGDEATAPFSGANETPTGHMWDGSTITDLSKGIHFKLERVVAEGQDDVYTLTYTSIGTPTQTGSATRTLKASGLSTSCFRTNDGEVAYSNFIFR